MAPKFACNTPTAAAVDVTVIVMENAVARAPIEDRVPIVLAVIVRLANVVRGLTDRQPSADPVPTALLAPSVRRAPSSQTGQLASSAPSVCRPAEHTETP